eukprot:3304208-Rhodomonas_salina.1
MGSSNKNSQTDLSDILMSFSGAAYSLCGGGATNFSWVARNPVVSPLQRRPEPALLSRCSASEGKRDGRAGGNEELV